MANRRAFIKQAALIVGGIYMLNDKVLGRLLQEGGIRMITERVGVYTEKGGTIGFYISEDGSVIIDTQFPDTAKNFYSQFKSKGGSKVKFLLNTHHHGDHTAGNSYLKQYADKIVAHENCPVYQEVLAKKGDSYNEQVYADTLFSSVWSEKIGNEILTGSHFGIGHTHDDAVYHFENENIAHVGDLVFNNIYPFIDSRPGGSVISGWIKVLESITEHYAKETKFIFGHADLPENVTGSVEDVYKMRDYLSALMEYVQGEIADGRELASLLTAKEIPGFSNIKATRPKAIEQNLEAAFNELKRKE